MADLWALALNASQSLSESELHGMVCGAAAAAGGAPALTDLVALAGADRVADPDALAEFVEAAVTDYFREDFAFHPLIPAVDEVSLDSRVAALSEWCGGFLAGVGSALEARELEAEAEEALQDLVAISAVEEDPEQDEASEWQLAEVEEYVKVAALLLQKSLVEED